MDDEKEYLPDTISENPLPGGTGVASYTVSQNISSNGPSGQSTIQEQAVPTRRIATDLISSNLNTTTRKILGEFSFTPSGAIQIGDYKLGISGDIRISPDGIVTRNKQGDVTIGIDGATGNAVFAGEIQAGTLISGAVAVGDGNILIDGATRRMLFYDNNGIPQIVIGLVS